MVIICKQEHYSLSYAKYLSCYPTEYFSKSVASGLFWSDLHKCFPKQYYGDSVHPFLFLTLMGMPLYWIMDWGMYVLSR